MFTDDKQALIFIFEWRGRVQTCVTMFGLAMSLFSSTLDLAKGQRGLECCTEHGLEMNMGTQ